MTMTQVRTTRAGFTLIEILVAVAIVAVMGVLVGPMLMKQFFGAQEKAAMASLKGIDSAIKLFYLDNNKYPEKLADLVKKPADVKRWNQYLEAEPRDPWGYKFVYKLTPGGKHPYELQSYGSDAGKNAPKEGWISVWDK